MAGSEEVKNTIRHHVLSLSKLFGVDPTSDSRMLDFVDRLEQSIGSFHCSETNVQSSLERLCEGVQEPQELIQKFNEVKLSNTRELNPLVYLYSRIKSEPELASALCEGVGFLEHYPRDSSASFSSLLHSVDTERTLPGPLVTPASDSLYLDAASLSGSQADDADLTVVYMTDRHRPGPDSRDRQGAGNKSRHHLAPDWYFNRPSLWNDYLPVEDYSGDKHQSPPIDSLSNDMQEHAVVKDLLQLLQGNEGVYIKPLPLSAKSSNRTFYVDENLSPTLVDMANKILPVCANYSTICRFIDEKSMFAEGTVNEALASAMRKLVEEYFAVLCQLDDEFRLGQLGINRLLFALQDTASVFTQLAQVVTDIRLGNCVGGAVLSVLHDHIRNSRGVAKRHQLMLYLLRAASVPFFSILQKWIFRGVISDPCNEFFIKPGPTPEVLQSGLQGVDVPKANREDCEDIDWGYFWEQHYSLIPQNLPTFLDSHVSKCLKAGKYLNVVQLCAEDYELPVPERIEYDDTDSRYLDQIDAAYSYSSGLLLTLMLKDKELKQHLKSVKRYFLLDQADFIVHFMDGAAAELCKPSSEVSLSRLSSLLELALRTSTAMADPNQDNLKVVIYNHDLITQILLVLQAGSSVDEAPPVPVEDSNLTALEAFSVDYTVQWPISLILNRQVMDRYQMLFRHLFYCKHVERRLCSSWVLGKMARNSDCLTSTWYSTAFLLGGRMLTFIQHLQYYMSVEVIEPTWQQFFNQLDKFSNLDALLEAHLNCLDICLDDCLLACPDLLSLFGKLAVVCVLFANFIQHVLSCSFAGSEDGNLLQEIESQSLATSYETLDGRRASSRSLYTASLASGETALTKVTRDDFFQLGTSTAFAQSVTDFDRKFNTLLMEFMDKLKHYAKERSKLKSLVSRLDFNDFYCTASYLSVVGSANTAAGSLSRRTSSHGDPAASARSTPQIPIPVVQPNDNDDDYI